MKKVIFVILIFASCIAANAQQFQTIKSGNITDEIFEQRPLNGGKWNPATILPTGYLIINRNDTVVINQNFSLDSILVKAGGTLIVNFPLSLLKDVKNTGGKVIDNNFIILAVSTGIEENISELFKIYASHGIIKISARNAGYLSIYNMYGQLCAKKYISEGGYDFSIQLIEGMYIAQFERLTKKFYFKN